MTYFTNLYSHLHVVVKIKTCQLNPFSFKKCIFQGDPWSPITFLTVFKPILECLAKESPFGYYLNGKKVITTPFSDDFNLISTHKTSHQSIINNISVWTKSINLKLKPPKCVSLSLCSGKPTPVNFTLDGTPLDTLRQSPHKFLGLTITFTGKQSDTYKVIYDHFHTHLTRIDNLEIKNEYKFNMYNKYLLPASQFILTIHELSATNLCKPEALTHKFLKTWSGLSHSVWISVLHLDQFMSIQSVTELYHQCHTNVYVFTRMKGDKLVNYDLDSRGRASGHTKNQQ